MTRSGGTSILDASSWASLVSSADPLGTLDAAVLLRRTGTPLASWTRDPVPADVVSVMTSTLLGSVETMMGAFRRPSPRSIRVETDECQLVATRIDPQSILVLLAPITVREAQVRTQARLLAAQVRGDVESARRVPAKFPAPSPPAVPKAGRGSQRIA